MPEKKEIVRAVVKGAVAGVPFVGGILAEVGDLFISRIDGRKELWTSVVDDAVDEIERRFSRSAEDLANDENFVSALLIATPIAIQSHQREKIEALQNALISTGDPSHAQFDQTHQYLRFVEELSVSHLQMLSMLQQYAAEFSDCEDLDCVFQHYSDVADGVTERHFFRSLLQDLESRFLIIIGDLDDMPEFASQHSLMADEDHKIRPLEVTPLGESFLGFISKYES